MRIAPVCVLAAALLAAGACSSVPGGRTQTKPPSITDLASKAGCSVITDSPSSFAAEEGSCEDYTITTFTSTDNRDKWLSSAQGAGGPYLVGDQWVLSGGERSALEQLRGSLGGAVRD